MAWRLLKKKDLYSLLDFLKFREWKTIALTSRLKETLVYRWSSREYYALLINEIKERGGSAIREVILMTRQGLILPVLDNSLPLLVDRSDSFHSLFLRFSLRIHSVMGPTRSVSKIESLLPRRPFASVDYNLMTKSLLDGIPSAPNRVPNLEVVPASPEDAERLFELQKDYELEEVFLDPRHFSDTICRTLLKNTLRKQIVFIAQCQGRPIGKAGTNARGFQVDQIGGVFTAREFRSRGIGAHLMCVLLRYLREEKPMASLYVKKDNPAAWRLYTKLEFRPREEYRISYYYK